MIEFKKTISQPEIDSFYLNLTDDFGNKYGHHFPSHKTTFVVVDSKNRKTSAKKHHANQIWGSVRNWYNENNINVGQRITVKFDINEKIDNNFVLHLISEDNFEQTAINVRKPVLQENSENLTEIPLSLEKQLEDFMSKNLELLENGLKLFEDEDGKFGQQYPTDVGIIDLLCKKKDDSFLVIELKRAKSSDSVIGQISRYMGWVKKHLANGREVYGLILSYESELSLKYALLTNPMISLKYFKLKMELVDEEEF